MTAEVPDGGAPGERAKRPPPTIDLDPSEVTVEKEPASRTDDGKRAGFRDRMNTGGFSFEGASSALTPALSGATAAALILIGAWLLGLSGDNRPAPVTALASADATAINALTARLTKVETDAAARANAPVQTGSDTALAARVDRIDGSLKSVNDAVASLRGDVDRVVAAAKQPDAAPREASPAPVADFSALEQRFAQIEGAQRALGEAAQRAVKPPDDRAIRRAVAANALDLAVRQGEPFVAALAAAKTVAPDAALQPLESFAASGLPGDAVLSRELQALLLQLSPPAPRQGATSNVGGLLDRLQDNAAKLVKVERVDAASGASSAQTAQTARIAAAARNNDIAAARAALMELPEAQRAPAQAWLGKVAARDEAREAARRYAAAALAALGQPAP